MLIANFIQLRKRNNNYEKKYQIFCPITKENKEGLSFVFVVDSTVAG
jgi:hypothetical protein